MADVRPIDLPDANGEHGAYECARAWIALREMHALVSEALTTTLAQECGLTINDFEVLVRLHSVAPRRLRLGDLGSVVPLSQPALSRLVMRLEQHGLVRRSDADDDRRSVLVELTDAGRATLQRAVPVHANCIRSLLTSRLTDDEQALLVAMFARVQSSP